jgi:putative chitinase
MLKTFQERIGVTPDGHFGPQTLKAGADYLRLKPLQAAHFFAQCAHESGNFTVLTENLNYSAARLVEVFPRYFPTLDIAANYDRKPEMIANRVYASRLGNGSEASGDGWRYRGRGAIQLTGRDNYKAFADYEGDKDILWTPDKVASEYALESALFFFDHNKLWSYCDSGVDDLAVTALTKRINGGTLGIDDRIKKTREFATILGVP